MSPETLFQIIFCFIFNQSAVSLSDIFQTARCSVFSLQGEPSHQHSGGYYCASPGADHRPLPPPPPAGLWGGRFGPARGAGILWQRGQQLPAFRLQPCGAVSRRAVFICLHRLSSALNVAWAYEVVICFMDSFFTRPLAARATRVRACYNLCRFCAVLRMVKFLIFWRH